LKKRIFSFLFFSFFIFASISPLVRSNGDDEKVKIKAITHKIRSATQVSSIMNDTDSVGTIADFKTRLITYGSADLVFIKNGIDINGNFSDRVNCLVNSPLLYSFSLDIEDVAERFRNRHITFGIKVNYVERHSRYSKKNKRSIRRQYISILKIAELKDGQLIFNEDFVRFERNNLFAFLKNQINYTLFKFDLIDVNLSAVLLESKSEINEIDKTVSKKDFLVSMIDEIDKIYERNAKKIVRSGIGAFKLFSPYKLPVPIFPDEQISLKRFLYPKFLYPTISFHKCPFNKQIENTVSYIDESE